MCGIFGYIVKGDTYHVDFLEKLAAKLAIYSESRGKESSGFAVFNAEKNEIRIIKAAEASSSLIKNKVFHEFFIHSTGIPSGNSESLALIGHSRLVTKGSEEDDFNNQPVIKDGIVGIHNGIVVNDDSLWEKNQQLKREYEVDTEILFALIRDHLSKSGNIKMAVLETMKEIYGTVSAAAFLNDYKNLLLFTNNGSLYILRDEENKIFIFASEKYILKRILKNKSFREHIGENCIYEVDPGSGYLIDIVTLFPDYFKVDEVLDKNDKPGQALSSVAATIDTFNIDVSSLKKKKLVNTLVDFDKIFIPGQDRYLEYNVDAIGKLKRCKRCLLPETFPNIEFDKDGVCNVCNNYIPQNQLKLVGALQQLIEPYKNPSGEPDCIVPYSGGRDSSFTMHYTKKVLGLNPVAFTYDWGMVTDLARRNIARVCGKLGIENIIVSANIKKKRENIRKNVVAWLKRPELGMIPLFMAGDKHFFFYTRQIQKQTGIKLNIWGINKLENTDFKVGFGGVEIQYNKERIYSLNYKQQVQLFFYIFKNVVQNRAYLNTSIYDSMLAFYSRYFSGKTDYYHFFDFYKWDEKEIIDLLRNEYDWEFAHDTKATWRIGDGTAPFYNYIYYTVAGFTELDAFRSNQIREGMLTREEAINLIYEENRPRYQSIKWYLDIIGLDFERTIKTINNIPKLYKDVL